MAEPSRSAIFLQAFVLSMDRCCSAAIFLDKPGLLPKMLALVQCTNVVSTFDRPVRAAAGAAGDTVKLSVFLPQAPQRVGLIPSSVDGL